MDARAAAAHLRAVQAPLVGAPSPIRAAVSPTPMAQTKAAQAGAACLAVREAVTLFR